MKRVFAVATWLSLLLPLASRADICMVLDESEKSRPDVDGPGSFGELQDTMSLGCLDYIGVTERGDSIAAILRDHKGRTHEIEIGEYVGENSGRVLQITPAVITIEQLVRGASGEYKKLIRFMHRIPLATAN